MYGIMGLLEWTSFSFKKKKNEQVSLEFIILRKGSKTVEKLFP